MVNRENSRVEVFRKIQTQLEADPPTYTDKDGNTATYTIVAAFPEVTPVFPCIVVNPIVKTRTFLGVGKRPHFSAPSYIKIDFFAKTRDGKNAIDVARGKIEMLIANNWITNETTINTNNGGELVTITGVE